MLICRCHRKNHIQLGNLTTNLPKHPSTCPNIIYMIPVEIVLKSVLRWNRIQIPHSIINPLSGNQLLPLPFSFIQIEKPYP